MELGWAPAADGCLPIWINDTRARSDLTSTPLASDIAGKWSRMITRVHRTPRQDDGRLANCHNAGTSGLPDGDVTPGCPETRGLC
jgi:hypothetical protein